MNIRIKRTHPAARLPENASEGAACFDLYAATVNGCATLGDIVYPGHPVVVDTGLARAKILANEIADRMESNIKSLKGEAHDWSFLFPDLATVAGKPAEDFANLLAARIAAHKQAEEQRRQREAEAAAAAAAGDAEAAARAQAEAEALQAQAAAAALTAQVVTVVPEVEAQAKVAGISGRVSYSAEVIDLLELVKAVAAGKAPIECVLADAKFLNAQARAFKKEGQLFPGVNIKAERSIAARAV